MLKYKPPLSGITYEYMQVQTEALESYVKLQWRQNRGKLDPNTKRFKRTLTYFDMDRTHSMHIFGEIPFIKPQNNT